MNIRHHLTIKTQRLEKQSHLSRRVIVVTKQNFQRYSNIGEIMSLLYFRSLLLQNRKNIMSQLP